MKLFIRTILISVLVMSAYVALSFFLEDRTLFLNLTGWTGFGSLALCLVVSGALVSGDRMRANTYSENSDDRKRRVNSSGIFLYFSIPPLVAFLLVNFVVE